jgi:branched-chain amino acid aminotransferase
LEIRKSEGKILLLVIHFYRNYAPSLRTNRRGLEEFGCD